MVFFFRDATYENFRKSFSPEHVDDAGFEKVATGFACIAITDKFFTNNYHHRHECMIPSTSCQRRLLVYIFFSQIILFKKISFRLLGEGSTIPFGILATQPLSNPSIERLWNDMGLLSSWWGQREM